MSTPFYVSPEQLMKDRADYARKGIARGRSVIVLKYVDGILMVAENGSTALHKVSEIYDRIAFAAVGKYNEFENLRVAGVRLADLRGYSYDRRDVTGRALANAYAQTLGTIFTQESKPYEVEIVVAEVGDSRRGRPDVPAHLRRLGVRRADLRRDGRHVRADQRGDARGLRRPDPARRGLRLAVRALAEAGPDGEKRTLTATQLEVAVLDRNRVGRTFRRLSTPVPQRRAHRPGRQPRLTLTRHPSRQTRVVKHPPGVVSQPEFARSRHSHGAQAICFHTAAVDPDDAFWQNHRRTDESTYRSPVLPVLGGSQPCRGQAGPEPPRP